MSKQSLIICALDRTPICDLMDNTPQRARNIIENRETNIITDLSFDLPIANPKWINVVNENLVFFKDEYYVIKKPTFNHDEDGKLYVHVACKHYSNNLAEDLVSIEEVTPRTVEDLMKIALCYDENGNPTKGWTVGRITVDRIVKRGLEAMEQSPFSILLTIAEKYSGMLHFNSKSMTVDLLELQDTTRPTIDIRGSKNLKSVNISYDTSNMYTRLYCYGAPDEDGNELDIMSVNPTGKPYIDNYEYFYKLGYEKEFVANNPQLFVKTTIWRDSNYYDAQDLYNDGVKELAKIAQPVVDISITALDISALGGNNNPCKLELGDCVSIVDEELGLSTLCNVIKREVNHEEPHVLNITVTNSITYHDTLSKLFTDVNTVSSVVTSGGHIIGATTMDGVKDYLNLYYLNTEQLEADYARIDTLEANYLSAEQIKATYIDANAIAATYATVGSLKAVEAQIKDLDVTKLTAELADIKELTAELADFDKLIADSVEIEELKASNVTVVGKLTATDAEIDTIKSTYAQVGSFEAYKGTIENLFSTNANIESLKSEYINALKLETDVAKITQLESAIAKIETLQASMATIEKLVSETIITQDLEASKATIESLTTKVANIDKAIIDIAQVEDLEAANAQIENLNTNYINAVKVDVDSLNAKSATISQLTAYTLLSDFGKFEDLTAENFKAANANIGTLNANLANIVNVLAGAVGTGLLQTIHLTADNVVIDDAVIKSAMIDNINTDIVTIGNDNIIISGSTQQFKDNNGVVRIQIGQDAEGNFSFIVANENGATIIGVNGITENAVPDGLIVDKMVSDDAGIQAKKIKYVDRDGDKTLQTVIEAEQGKVETLIKETTITNDDGSTTSLKDAYTHTVQTVEGIETTIGDVTMLGEGESLVSSITNIKATADGISTQVSSIGGQNLFYSCSKDWVNKTEGEDYIYVGCYKENTDNDMEGEYVTLSLEIKTDDTTSGTFDICYYGVNNPTTEDVITLFENIPLTDLKKGKYVNTFIYPNTDALIADKDGSMPLFTMVVRVTNVSGIFSVRKGMFQYGKLATEWQPSSDNVSESLSIARQDSDKISWLIKSGDDETNFELTPRTATLVSNEINLKGLVTFSGLNSNLQQQIEFGGTLSNQTKNSGIELIDRRYEVDLNQTPFTYGAHEVVSATALGSSSNESNLIKTTDYVQLYTDFIPWSFNESPFYCSADVYYEGSTDGMIYIQVGFFDESKQPIGSNNGWNLNLIRVAAVSKANAWVTYTYETNDLIVSDATNPRKLAKYIRFRYLPRYNSSTGVAYLRNFVIKQLGATSLTTALIDTTRWASDAIVSGTTEINGGYIKTNTIQTKHLNVEEMFANQAYITKLKSVEIDADRITSGTIKSNFIELYGMEVKQKDTGITTLYVEDSGDITLRGSLESYNFVSGKTGWAINKNGDVEFNDITARGSVITNDGGIVSNGGSGENLQQDTSFANGSISSYWRYNTNYFSVDTSMLCQGVNSVKFSRTGLTESSTVYLYTHTTANAVVPKVGEYYTVSAKFYTKNYSAIDGAKPFIGAWFYNLASDGTSTSIATGKVNIPFANNEWVDVSHTFQCPSGANRVAIVIGVYRNGEFWIAQPKLEQGDVATAWSLSPKDGIQQVIFYAGSSYEERESAPFIVYNDGSIKATKGQYSGLWTGDIQIGNISIIDPSSNSGNDAIVTIQNGGNGVKRVQLRDTNQSDFAQNINITDNYYNTRILLGQDGVGTFVGGVVVGNATNKITLNSTSININNSILNASNGVMRVLSDAFKIGSASESTDVEIWGKTTLQNDLVALGDINIGNKLKVNVKSNGVDIDFVE